MLESVSFLIPLLPLLPLLGFLANMFFIRNERSAGLIASATVGLTFILSLIVFISFALGNRERIDFQVWTWINTGALIVPFGFLYDSLSGVMTLLITGVGTLIHIYSIGYMHGDKRPVRYFAYLNLFVAMMLTLILADNLLLLFLGWEGVGLCSFLLIGHWFERKSASAAAVKAFVVNRIGDAGLLLAMMAIFAITGSLSFYSQNLQGGAISLPGFLDSAGSFSATFNFPGQPMILATAVTFLILIGVAGKSAQFPLLVWLPDAMEGPTPVSALIHAATMVTAGVYLLLRVEPLLAMAPGTQSWILWIGALTALIGATAALAQWDIKRVLAYSTVSQLGFMVVAVGLGAYTAALFHLLTHGIFKALLFLGSGSVIHAAGNVQDMRRMGGLRKALPTTFWTYMVGSLALAGIFPLAGFWSKDEIIADAFHHNMVVFLVLFLASILTALYMGRQIALVFFGEQRDHSYHPHESPKLMTTPLIILAVGTIIGGVINLPGSHFLHDWLQPVIAGEAAPFGTTEIVLAIVATLVAAAAFYFSWRFYNERAGRLRANSNDPIYRGTGAIWEGFNEAWYLDALYKSAIVQPFRSVANFIAQVFDPRGIDGLIGGIVRALNGASTGIGRIQNGFLRTYALVFLIGVVLLVGYFVAVNR